MPLFPRMESSSLELPRSNGFRYGPSSGSRSRYDFLSPRPDFVFTHLLPDELRLGKVSDKKKLEDLNGRSAAQVCC